MFAVRTCANDENVSCLTRAFCMIDVFLPSSGSGDRQTYTQLFSQKAAYDIITRPRHQITVINCFHLSLHNRRTFPVTLVALTLLFLGSLNFLLDRKALGFTLSVLQTSPSFFTSALIASFDAKQF